MILTKATTHLYNLVNNIYTRKISPTNIFSVHCEQQQQKRCEICSKLRRRKTPERHSTVFIVNILHTFFLVFLLTLNK